MPKKFSIGAAVAVPVILAAALAPAALTHAMAAAVGGSRCRRRTPRTASSTSARRRSPTPATPTRSATTCSAAPSRSVTGAACAPWCGSTDDGTAMCVETYRLPKGRSRPGSITFDLATGATEYSLAVTGGTGAYRAVEGEVRTVESDGGANGTHTFRLAR